MTVPQNIRHALAGRSDTDGKAIRDLEVFHRELAASYEFRFVNAQDLDNSEWAIFRHVEQLVRMVGGLPKNVKEIKVSETMRPDLLTGDATVGLWDADTRRIIIKRSQLASLPLFAGTLLHEITHAATGHPDVSRAFESALTELIGSLAAAHCTPSRT